MVRIEAAASQSSHKGTDMVKGKVMSCVSTSVSNGVDPGYSGCEHVSKGART